MSGHGRIERRYELHGLVAVVSGCERAIPALAEVDRRLAGFRRESAGKPDLLIEFDVSPETLIEHREAARPVYDLRGGSVMYDADQDLVVAEIGGVGLTCDAAAGHARLSCAEFSGERLYLAAHPLCTIAMLEMLKRRGLYAIHAACLARDGNGVLLHGPSGSGKSTLAVALARAGLDFLGDDFVFLRPGDPLQILGFPDTIGLGPGSRELLGIDGEGRAAVTGFTKPLYEIGELSGAAVAASCRPVALIRPRIADGASRLLSEEPGDAYLALVPDVLLTDATAAQLQLEALAALTGAVSCFRLESGPRLAQTVSLVQGLLA